MLRPLMDVLERTESEPIEVCVSVPPRHGKTTTIVEWMTKALARKAALRLLYVTYSDHYAAQVEGRVRSGLGDGWSRARSVGGLMRGVGIDRALVGAGFDVIVVEGVHKNRAAAENPRECERVYQAFCELETRRMPGGSVVVADCRWQPRDLIGRLTHRPTRPYELVKLPALDPAGAPLAPHLFSSEDLALVQRLLDARTWAALYQGEVGP